MRASCQFPDPFDHFGYTVIFWYNCSNSVHPEDDFSMEGLCLYVVRGISQNKKNIRKCILLRYTWSYCYWWQCRFCRRLSVPQSILNKNLIEILVTDTVLSCCKPAIQKICSVVIYCLLMKWVRYKGTLLCLTQQIYQTYTVKSDFLYREKGNWLFLVFSSLNVISFFSCWIVFSSFPMAARNHEPLVQDKRSWLWTWDL